MIFILQIVLQACAMKIITHNRLWTCIARVIQYLMSESNDKQSLNLDNIVKSVSSSYLMWIVLFDEAILQERAPLLQAEWCQYLYFQTKICLCSKDWPIYINNHVFNIISSLIWSSPTKSNVFIKYFWKITVDFCFNS